MASAEKDGQVFKDRRRQSKPKTAAEEKNKIWQMLYIQPNNRALHTAVAKPRLAPAGKYFRLAARTVCSAEAPQASGRAAVKTLCNAGPLVEIYST